MTTVGVGTVLHPQRAPYSVRWISHPVVDLCVAFAWAPVVIAAHHWAADERALASLTAAVLVVSFCHQPVTLPLVYGSAVERRSHRRLALAAPPLAVVAVALGLTVSLMVVAVVSAVWNAHHTLRQRYGLVRVYGRKVGQDDGTGEQALLVWWFLAAVAAAVASPTLTERLAGLAIGQVNERIVLLLADLRPVAMAMLVPVTAVAVCQTVAFVRRERRRPVRNPAKWVYLAGAAGLFAVAPFDPVAAFLGFMAAHALEYLAVVSVTVRRRVDGRSLVGRMTSVRGGPVLFLTGYVALVLAVVAGLRLWLPGLLFLSLYLGVGVLHFTFDGLIWKLRSDAGASSFRLGPAPV